MPHASARRLAATGLATLALLGASSITATATPLTDDGQWGLDRIDQRTGLNGQYNQNLTGAGVTVYVVDTGVEGTHPEFGGRVRAGHSTVDDTDGTGDCSDHGTHVAGIAAGDDHGVARQASIVPVKVLGCGFAGNDQGLIDGINWMVNHHRAGTPAVANLSIAYPASGSATASQVDAAVERAIADGITVVIAAGNESMSAADEYPGRVANALTVGATNNVDLMTDFSSYGSAVDLLAPGYNIASATHDGGIGLKSGTSMSAPFVAGAAALVLQAHPTWTPAQVSSFLVSNATNNVIGNVAHDTPNRLLWAGFSGTAPAPAPTPVAPAPKLAVTGAPRITGTLAVGRTVGSALPTFSPAARMTYRWYRFVGNTATLVSTRPNYVVQPADRGQRLRLCVIGSRSGYAPTSSCGAISGTVAPGTITLSATPSITGTARLGRQVIAVTRVWGPSPVTLRYQWYRVNSRGTATAIPGATRNSYTNTRADKGYRMRVRITGSKAGYSTRAAWSLTSYPVG